MLRKGSCVRDYFNQEGDIRTIPFNDACCFVRLTLQLVLGVISP